MPHEEVQEFLKAFAKDAQAPFTLATAGVGGAQLSAWLQSALRMLAAGLVGGVGFEAAQRAFPPEGLQFPGNIIDAPSRILGIDGQVKRRRRRRRALTASDRADIAFIAGILGKPAGKDIAAIIAART